MAVTRFSGCFMNEDSKLNPGRKVGLQLSYTSTNTLTLSKGFYHINNGTNDYLVEKAATTITNATTGWPGVGAGAYITGKPDGTITLRASTCTAAVRPSDNLFQLTGGSAGYNDIGLFAYMYDADERVLAHFWEVSSTDFYIINLGDRKVETGRNSCGFWKYQDDDITEVWGAFPTVTTTTNTAFALPVALAYDSTYGDAGRMVSCSGSFAPSSNNADNWQIWFNSGSGYYYAAVNQPLYWRMIGTRG